MECDTSSSNHAQTWLIAMIQVLVGIIVGMLIYRPVMWLIPPSTHSSGSGKKPEKVPKHIGVIMDGNRRFGRQKHADPLKGHWAGGQTLVDFVQWCMSDGVEILTVYAFSTENWSREQVEVQTLMTIFAKYAESFKVEALNNNVRVRVLSTDLERLPVRVLQSVEALESATAACTGFQLNICLSYGARAEIINGCRAAASAVQRGCLKLEDIDESSFSQFLATKGLPDPEILIRTSGEYRLSNFMLWQAAYTELFFIEKFWPEVTREDLTAILCQFNERKRRFGK